MSVVIPLASCWARPPGGAGTHLLVRHLVKVAEACGDAKGTPGERLAFLAGLLHDAAKSHRDWQAYIRGQLRRGPPHAPFGAAIFCFCAQRLLPPWCGARTELDAHTDSLLEWAVALHGHHGRLNDLDIYDPPWDLSAARISVPELIAGCPLDQVFSLLTGYWPELRASPAEFQNWLKRFPDDWERWVRVLRPTRVKHTRVPFATLASRLPTLSARLIWADRSEAGSYEESFLTPEQSDGAERHLVAYCQGRAESTLAEGADRGLVDSRRKLQKAALERYRRSPTAPLYTLQVATGYGKTLAALRIALEACREGRCNRIVYVAPYISILSQASREIGKACGLPVLEHHHLALLERFDPATAPEAGEKADDQDFDALDTWRAPILATTFNQLFRALFPRRAQHTLRLSALDRSFIVVDEPQIMDTGVWNLFLGSLHNLCVARGAQALLATATLPPLFAGLEVEPENLAPSLPAQHRFRIEWDERPLDLSQLAASVPDQLRGCTSLAIVVNTVRDAVDLYRRLREQRNDGVSLQCLTAMMLPAHKARAIERIKDDLAADRRSIAVCTQVLEAGVDLSFGRILRALPTFPCLAQVAGRANRHGERDTSIVRVFPLRRSDGSDMRPVVYRDPTSRRQTDRLLAAQPVLAEPEVNDALYRYFESCWQENPQTQSLEKFEKASLGEWSALAGMEPFGAEFPRTSVFVPTMAEELKPGARSLLQQWAPEGPERLLERAVDKNFRLALSFQERKRFSLLIRQFCVPVPQGVARQIAAPFNDWLWMIADLADYSKETGLAHHLLEEGEDSSSLIL